MVLFCGFFRSKASVISNRSDIVRSYIGAGEQAPLHRKLQQLCCHMLMHEISKIQNWKIRLITVSLGTGLVLGG